MLRTTTSPRQAQTSAGGEIPSSSQIPDSQPAPALLRRNGAVFDNFEETLQETPKPSITSRLWKDQILRVFGEEITLPPEIDSRNVDSAQLLSTFLSLYVPRARDPSMDQLTYLSFLPELCHRSALLKSSCYALALAFIGSI
jgi:hypothetical protein